MSKRLTLNMQVTGCGDCPVSERNEHYSMSYDSGWDCKHPDAPITPGGRRDLEDKEVRAGKLCPDGCPLLDEKDVVEGEEICGTCKHGTPFLSDDVDCSHIVKELAEAIEMDIDAGWDGATVDIKYLTFPRIFSCGGWALKVEGKSDGA